MNPSNETLLLVEDRTGDVLLLEHALKRANLGRLVHVARSGEEMIAYLEGNEKYANRASFPFPTTILLDLKLPGLSGFEVLTWIRQQPRFDRIKVVVLTGSRHTIDVYRAYELGANSFLVKPVDVQALENAMRLPSLAWPNSQKQRRAAALPAGAPS